MELKPSADDLGDILIEAGKISARLKVQLVWLVTTPVL